MHVLVRRAGASAAAPRGGARGEGAKRAGAASRGEACVRFARGGGGMCVRFVQGRGGEYTCDAACPISTG